MHPNVACACGARDECGPKMKLMDFEREACIKRHVRRVKFRGEKAPLWRKPSGSCGENYVDSILDKGGVKGCQVPKRASKGESYLVLGHVVIDFSQYCSTATVKAPHTAPQPHTALLSDGAARAAGAGQ